MEIKTATEEDIPAIVNLLKVSLGEALMPKSETYWRWKHVKNPFGASPVLLAVEAGEVVGVRGFMRWQWTNQHGILKALRAVDTATHPSHQGKGIFKKLTLALVELCTQEKDDFIFNTPNASSKPGYLKMGWGEAGKLPVQINVRRPFSILGNMIRSRKPVEDGDTGDQTLQLYLNHAGLKTLLENSVGISGEHLVTRISPEYLSWRYGDVPVASYFAFGIGNKSTLEALLIGRKKNTRAGKEFRITDVFCSNATSGRQLMKDFKNYESIRDVDYITVSGAIPGSVKNSINHEINFFNARLGPMVTIRNLRYNAVDQLKYFTKWSPSLGDLELF
jgi:GNAT superfamily N-acetyltransferase